MNASRLIKTVMFTPGPKGHWGLPLLMEGPPGSAKSSIVEQVGQECGLHVETVIASVREPADFLGLPIPNGDRVEYMPTSWAYRASRANRAVGFLDELNTAPEAVQAALLRVVLDRCVGDLQLPKGVRILAAQNSVEEAAGGHDLSMPLANRFVHLAWEAPSANDWSAWVLGGAGSSHAAASAEAEEARVMAVWEPLFAKARGLVTAFIARRPELLHKQPKAGDPQASKAWPSRRTWEMAMRALAGAEAHELSPIESETLVAGCVGTGPAAEFVAWLTANDLPAPADLLDGKVEPKFDKRLDRTMAILSSCAALVISKDDNAERVTARRKAMWKLMRGPAADAADVCFPAAQALIKAGASRDKEAVPVLAKLQSVLEIPGVQI